MENHVWVWAALAAVILVLCLIVAWTRVNKWYRWGAILCGIAIGCAAYPVQVNLLSRPRNVTEEWFNRHAKEALVTGVYVDEGTALYLYLMLPGVREPRSYKFDWSEATKGLAESLQEALGSEEGQENGVTIPSPFEEHSLERDKPLTAHPRPQQKLPDKPQPQAPMEFRGASYIILEPSWWRPWWI